jgi:hypothetical protein
MLPSVFAYIELTGSDGRAPGVLQRGTSYNNSQTANEHPNQNWRGSCIRSAAARITAPGGRVIRERQTGRSSLQIVRRWRQLGDGRLPPIATCLAIQNTLR